MTPNAGLIGAGSGAGHRVALGADAVHLPRKPTQETLKKCARAGARPELVRRWGLRSGELERRHGAELAPAAPAWERVLLLRLSDVGGVRRLEG
eukprot:COSAG04_NODE_9455_length_862_cov_1.463958_1_plen_94_part_00